MIDQKIKLNPNEEIQIIKNMIEKSKKNTVDSSWQFLLWGWLILSSCFLVYIISFAGYPEISWIPWAILMPTGGIIQMIVGIKTHKKQKVLTYTEKSIGWIWISCGFAMFIIAFLAPITGIIGWQAISPLIALIVGIGTLTTAKILEWKLLIICSAFWWISAIILMLINPNFQILVMAITVILGYLVPGYTIRYKYKAIK